MRSGDRAGEYRTGHEIVGKFVDVVMMGIIPVTVIRRSRVQIPSGPFLFLFSARAPLFRIGFETNH
jgi:hypothetical protein